MNTLDLVVKSNIKDKDQCNYLIEYYTKIDNKFSLSSDNKYPHQ